jgi:hypothetical protein
MDCNYPDEFKDAVRRHFAEFADMGFPNLERDLANGDEFVVSWLECHGRHPQQIGDRQVLERVRSGESVEVILAEVELRERYCRGCAELYRQWGQIVEERRRTSSAASSRRPLAL